MPNTPVPTAAAPTAEQATLDTLRLVFDAAPIGIAISGPDLRFRLVNQNLADMLGYSRGDLIGKTWSDLTHPEDMEASRHLVETLAQGEIPPAIHKRYLHKSGRVVWATLTARSLVDESSGERVTLALIQDTSTQRRSEELTRSLSEQTSRLAAIIQKSPLAVVLTNDEGEMTYCNRAALDMLGISEPIEALGQSIGLVDAGEDGRTSTILDHIQDADTWTGERYFRTIGGDGGLLAVHVTAFRLEAQQSGVRSLAFVAKDISERKRIEIELREREERLRHLAQRLIRAQEEERSRIARDLHDDVTQRLAMIAVEIGFLQTKPEADQGLLLEKLEAIRGQVVELTDTIRDLSHEYHPSALSHSNLQTALESLCYEFEKQHGIQTRYRSRADTDAVSRPIAIAVYRIIQEAMRNIARHSSAERVVLTLECEGDELRIALLDDGKGFDTLAVRKRRGLGLTSMEERAGAIRGSLQIHSEPGAGTRVEIVAPMVEGCEDDDDGGK